MSTIIQFDQIGKNACLTHTHAVCVCACVHACVCVTCILAYTYVCVRVRMHMQVCMKTCMCVEYLKGRLGQAFLRDSRFLEGLKVGVVPLFRGENTVLGDAAVTSQWSGLPALEPAKPEKTDNL